MTDWELRDESGAVRKRIRGPRRFAEQFERVGLTLAPAAFARAVRGLRGPQLAQGVSRPRVPVPRVRRVASAGARAKRERMRARLESGAAAFTRRALLALIDAGALDQLGEE